MNLNLEKRIKYLDSIFCEIDKLSQKLQILSELKIVKFRKDFKNFNVIFKIIKLINKYKLDIRSEILGNLNKEESYCFNFDKKKLTGNLKINKTKLTNDYKFYINNKEKFIEIKNQINLIISKMNKVDKIKYKQLIIDYKGYCSDYSNMNVSKYSLIKMNNYKIQLNYR